MDPIKKLAEADFTVSLRSSSAPLVVTEEESIPEPFWKPQSPKLDRQGLIAALKSGRQVSGAVLGKLNAVKHGLTAEHVVIPGEDPAELEELRRSAASRDMTISTADQPFVSSR